MKPPLDRRRFLATATSLIALPAFESLGFRRFAAAAPAPRPKRLVFLGFGWGVTNDSWYPDAKTPGRDFLLPPGLAPLERHKADFSIVQGLWHRHTANGHYGSTFWLTGANEFGQPGQAFHNTISVDQVAASRSGAATRFDSLCLDCGEAAGGSGLRLGENIVVPKGTPLCNAWLTILRGSGLDVAAFGDSTGVLEPLVA